MITTKDFGINESYQISDALWEHTKPFLPAPKSKKKPGRPRMNDRQAMTAIFYILRTGCQWKALPRSLGASSTVHDRFQEWCEARVFTELWRAGLMEYDKKVGIDWEWPPRPSGVAASPKHRWVRRPLAPIPLTGPRKAPSAVY